MSGKGKRESIARGHIEAAYGLELSVGASHVASTLYPASRRACIEELCGSFLARYGSAHLRSFLLALADKLDARANAEGAAAVRHYATYGATPESSLIPASTVAKKKTNAA